MVMSKKQEIFRKAEVGEWQTDIQAQEMYFTALIHWCILFRLLPLD